MCLDASKFLCGKWVCHSQAAGHSALQACTVVPRHAMRQCRAQAWGLDAADHSGCVVERRFDANISAALRSSQYPEPCRVRKMKAPAHVALAQLLSEPREPGKLSGSFHVIYVDGSHEPADVLTDAVLAWRLLLTGGLLILDDYKWHEIIDADSIKCPKPAIDAFLSVFEAQLIVLELDYQCIVQKMV